MKCLILSIALLKVLSFDIKSQTITIKDFISLSSCKSFSCFNDYIIKKGFSYEHSNNSNERYSYLYISNESFPTSSNPEVSTKNTALLVINSDSSSLMGIRTAIIDQYNKLLQETKTLGFKEFSTTNITNGILVQYRSTKYPKIIIYIQTDKVTKNNLSWTSYDIQVHHLK